MHISRRSPGKTSTPLTKGIKMMVLIVFVAASGATVVQTSKDNSMDFRPTDARFSDNNNSGSCSAKCDARFLGFRMSSESNVRLNRDDEETMEVDVVNQTHNTRLHRVREGGNPDGLPMTWVAEPPNEIGPGQSARIIVRGPTDSQPVRRGGGLRGPGGSVDYYPVTLTSDVALIPSPVPDNQIVHLAWNDQVDAPNVYVGFAPPPYAVNQSGITFSVGGVYGPNTCFSGYTWRGAIPGDHVCVAPQTRDQAAQDNAAADSRRNPGGGEFGPDTCRQGYVWREAYQNDHVCVTPATQAQVGQDNQMARARII